MTINKSIKIIEPKTENTTGPQPSRVCDYPAPLQGLASNKFGGNKLQRIRGLRGSKPRPASRPKIYTAQEIKDYCDKHGLAVSPSRLKELKDGEDKA